jgi:hypothetical protein
MTNELLKNSLKGLSPEKKNSAPIVVVEDPKGQFKVFRVIGMGNRDAFANTAAPGEADVPGSTLVLLAMPN